MRHILQNNCVLSIPKQAIKGFNHVFVGNSPCDKNFIDSAGQFGAGNAFPLYLYPETKEHRTNSQTIERIPNLKVEIANQIGEKLGLTFINEKEFIEGTFAPIDILDYIYGLLHSPTYREKYKEFLKIDFPRVPYPTDNVTFWQLVKLGGELRQIHLLESPIVDKRITTYPQAGSNLVDKPRFENDKVWVNPVQYFDHVPVIAWDFYIGGYQPAQKWLKDRKGRELSFEDILHYQKIIVALAETDRLMKEIDKIDLL
jgi:predicted helicase